MLRPGSGPAGPLRIALLCSGRAPGLAALLEARGGGGIDVVVCMSTDPSCREQALLRDAGVPFRCRHLRRWYGEAGAPITDLGVRARFDEATAALLRPFAPDLLVLSGYLFILTAPMLAAFPRILNVHHSDMCVVDREGRPRYRGLRAVRDAIFDGAGETRISTHLVGPEVDVGPVVSRSAPFRVAELARDPAVRGADDILRAYAYAHREWMVRAAWGPLLAETVELFARGAVEVRGGTVWVDGAPGPVDLGPGIDRLLGVA